MACKSFQVAVKISASYSYDDDDDDDNGDDDDDNDDNGDVYDDNGGGMACKSFHTIQSRSGHLTPIPIIYR